MKWLHTSSGSSRILIVGVSKKATGPAPTGIIYGGMSFTRIVAATTGTGGSDDVRVELWYLLSPPTGTHDITIDFTSTESQVIAGATSWTGVDQVTPLGDSNSAVATGGTLPSISVKSADNEMVVDVLSTMNQFDVSIQTASVGEGQAERWNHKSGGSTQARFGAGSSKLGAATVTTYWTLSRSSRWATAAVALKPVPLPSPPTPPTPPKPPGPRPPGPGPSSGILDSLQLEISVPYLIGKMKAKIDVGGVGKEIELSGSNKGYTLDLKGSDLSLNKEYNLSVTSDKTLVKKVKFTPTSAATSLKVGDLILGDLNQDNTIDSTDQLKLIDSITSQTLTGDVNVDEVTNSFDWAILLTNFGKKGD
jgi:hypothetical protein